MGQIRSNCYRGDYMRELVDRTISEIHDDVVTVFGPYATDAYLTINGATYYTRDGLETVRSMSFDNPLAMYILKIMYQAIYDQGKKVGDGTTTLAVFYTNLYKLLRDTDGASMITRSQWNDAVKSLTDIITTYSHKMDKNDLHDMLITCTQDTELAAKIFDNLADPILNQAFITINKSNIETDFSMTVHESPLFKVTRQFSIKPVANKEDNVCILHCNGILDIAHKEVFMGLMRSVAAAMGPDNQPVYYPKTVILLCNGLTDATRRTIKEFLEILGNLKTGGADMSQYNNVAIYTLDEYRAYTTEQIEDISTVITDENGIGGLVNQLTFESLLYQAFNIKEFLEIPELSRYDVPIDHITKIKDLFMESYPAEFDTVAGMRIHKKLGPVAEARHQDLIKEIDEEKSEVKKLGLNKRLRTMYGKFIEVEVGSKLIKDSQRKYELIMDAILSASEGVEKGVLRCNSMLVVLGILNDYLTHKKLSLTLPNQVLIYEVLKTAIANTFDEMCQNRPDWPADSYGIMDVNLHDMIPEAFNLKADRIDRVLPPKASYDPNTDFPPEPIVEPVSIINTMLSNSTLVLELANAKTIHLAQEYMENYI